MYLRKRLKTDILSILVSGLLSLFPLTAPTARAEDTQPSGVRECGARAHEQDTAGEGVLF